MFVILKNPLGKTKFPTISTFETLVVPLSNLIIGFALFALKLKYANLFIGYQLVLNMETFRYLSALGMTPSGSTKNSDLSLLFNVTLTPNNVMIIMYLLYETRILVPTSSVIFKLLFSCMFPHLFFIISDQTILHEYNFSYRRLLNRRNYTYNHTHTSNSVGQNCTCDGACYD